MKLIDGVYLLKYLLIKNRRGNENQTCDATCLEN